MKMSRLLPLLVMLLCAPAPIAAAELRVTVTGLRSARGDVHFAVYATPEHFPKREGRVAKAVVKAGPRGATKVFAKLTPGTYAVAVYHDENGNDEFDQGIFAIPLEDYGFSNGATAFFGPPDFAAAAFAVEPDGTAITIRLND